MQKYFLAKRIRIQLVGSVFLATSLLVFGWLLAAYFWKFSSFGFLFGLLGLLALAVVLAGLVWWPREVFVVRPEGYLVNWVRGVGAKQARWDDVDDAVATEVAGAKCIALRLKDGTQTTIPVSVLEVAPDQFVRDLQQYLQDGNGYRRVR